MRSNPLLEEIWAIRRELDRQAGGDLATHCEQTRQWAATHPLPNPRVHPDEIEGYIERIEAEARAVADSAVESGVPG